MAFLPHGQTVVSIERSGMALVNVNDGHAVQETTTRVSITQNGEQMCPAASQCPPLFLFESWGHSCQSKASLTFFRLMKTKCVPCTYFCTWCFHRNSATISEGAQTHIKPS